MGSIIEIRFGVAMHPQPRWIQGQNLSQHGSGNRVREKPKQRKERGYTILYYTILYNYTIMQLYYYTIIRLYYYIMVLLYYHTIIRLYDYASTLTYCILLYDYAIIRFFYYTTILLYELYDYTMKLLYYYTITRLLFCTIILLYHYTIILLCNWYMTPFYCYSGIVQYILGQGGIVQLYGVVQYSIVSFLAFGLVFSLAHGM